MIRIVKTGDRRIEKFNARPAFPEEAEKAAASALAEIKASGVIGEDPVKLRVL